MRLNPGREPRVSVLVPVFNGERHLTACLESIGRQSLKDLEVICIDDGSEDRSREIIRRYQKADDRFRVATHERNLGEGAARNTGLDLARGQYVFHLDADDVLPDTALERLWTTAAEHSSEIVKGGFSMMSSDGEMLQENLQSPRETIINTSLADSEFLRRIPGSHCSYLYRRAFLNMHRLRYRTDMSIGLDLVALSDALTVASRVSLIPDVVYHYRQTEKSATRGSMTLTIVEEDLKTKRLVHDNLRCAGFEEAARDVYQTWDWHISEYWMKLPGGLRANEVESVFARFRSMIPSGLVPWKPVSPLAHRYFLTLILQERDAEAMGFLTELQSHTPFAQSPHLNQRCIDILDLAPDDAEAGRFAGGQV